VGNGSRLGDGMLSALRKNKHKSEEAVRRWRGGGGGGVQAAAANLTLRFSTRHHLHRRWGFNPAYFVISNIPLARRAGFSCAAAFNARPATILAFARHRFDLPIPSMVLQQHAAVAALAVPSVAAARFTRAIVNAR
jgi:hypothetical protein